MSLHHMLDWEYGADGDEALREKLANGANPNEPAGPRQETPLHVAVRRRRLTATNILLDAGANIDAKTSGGKTAYARAIRRGFAEIVECLRDRGADTSLNEADQFAVAVVEGRLDEARDLLRQNPGIARTGNPEEDRLLADVAGRNKREPVELLINAGADLAAPALDDGGPLHQAAWFGQPQNAELLIAAGAPLDDFENDHNSSPLHWAVHGSRYSGGATEQKDAYIKLVKMLLAAGSSLRYLDDPNGDAYYQRMCDDAPPYIHALLTNWST